MFGLGIGIWPMGNGGGGVVKNTLFGLNMAGAELSTPIFPVTADWSYLARKGVTNVRLLVAWENFQTALNGSLQTIYLNNVKAAIASAYAAGIGVVLKLNNYGMYAKAAAWGSSVTTAGNAGILTANVNVLGDGTLSSSNLVDLWNKLSTALAGTAGLVGYDIMNEPSNSIIGTNLAFPANFFLYPATWFQTNGGTATQLAAGTNPLGATFGPAWNVTSGTGFNALALSLTLAAVPYTLSAYASVASGTDSNFLLQIGSTASSGKTLTTSPQRFSLTTTPTAGSNLIQMIVNEAAGHTFIISNIQLELGSSASAYQPSPWLPIAQAAVTAIRLNDAATPMYIQGQATSGASFWSAYNYELAQITGTKLIFSAHTYFDSFEGGSGPGSYSGNYSSYGIDNQSGVDQAEAFTTWLSQASVKGDFGEFNVPNSTADNNAQWLVLQQNYMNYLRAQSISGCMLFYGSNNAGSGEILQVNPQSGVDDPRLTEMLAS